MTVVLACIDGSVYSHSVADHAAWAASRLGRPVELLQVLGRREAASKDRSGRIVAGARRQLLDQLANLDAERARLLQQQARLELDDARSRIEAAGVTDVKTVLRNGDLMEALADREPDVELMVIGKRGEAADFAKLHLGSNLERIVRASHKPILIAARAFGEVGRFAIAFDGKSSALQAVESVAASPLLAGAKAELITVGAESEDARQRLERAAETLRAGGFETDTHLEPGQPDQVIPEMVKRLGIDLLVMGAYAHSRLRTLVIGSTTSHVIRDCRIPILVYR